MTYYKFLDENLQGRNGFIYDLSHWNGKSWEPKPLEDNATLVCSKCNREVIFS